MSVIIKLLGIGYHREEVSAEDAKNIQQLSAGSSYSRGDAPDGSTDGKHIWLVSENSATICGKEIHLCLKRRYVIDNWMAYDMNPRVLSGSTGMEYRLFVEGVLCATLHDESDNSLCTFDVKLCENTTEEGHSVRVSYEAYYQRGFSDSGDVADIQWEKDGEFKVTSI